MVNFRKELYPFVGSYLDLDGIRRHYLDEGSGDPVVMLHGNPTWSFYYRNLVLALRDSFRVVVFRPHPKLLERSEDALDVTRR